MKCYGQEINPLSAAIGKMNLFLNGVLNFKIVNADTLKYPAFTEAGQLKQFDIVLANPPYSISSWNRDAFETDQYGRNFLGVPPQGRADYAFFQHILKSLKPESGRCAILFPHGVLFRGEEKDMREKLIQQDLVECVIGLGKNLFYNSPMEACIVICNMNKRVDRKNKILFINAKHEVTRKNSQSFLEDNHIKKIASTYNEFNTIDGFSYVASIEEIQQNDYELTISLYANDDIGTPPKPIEISLPAWIDSSKSVQKEYSILNSLIGGGDTDA
jgi:type I restriction enzyme M protein